MLPLHQGEPDDYQHTQIENRKDHGQVRPTDETSFQGQGFGSIEAGQFGEG
jgi:hypothetical protein